MNQINNVIKTVRKNSPILFGIVMINILFALISIVGIFVDERTLMGVNVWIKPLKFAISTGIYILTVVYLITLYPHSKRKRNILNNLVSWSLLFEVGIIVAQGARSVQSHYNQTSLLDGLLFAAMGILIAINVLIMGWFVFHTLRLKLKVDKTIQWTILFGWIIILVGSWIGGQMISQLSHNIGIADGGDGLPLVNWSTIAGDLRVAHFFGIHGLQAIPFFAYILLKKDQNYFTNQTYFGNIVRIVLCFCNWICVLPRNKVYLLSVSKL